MLIGVPIIFLVLGYSIMYVIGKPVIQFVSSSIDLILLSDVPTFKSSVKASATTIKTTSTTDTIASSKVKYPVAGEQYATVIVKDLNLNVPLYYGDTQEILRYGAGQFMGSVFPGESGTTMAGGHNGTTFGKLLYAKEGMDITVNTTYGSYHYTVKSVDILYQDNKTVTTTLNQKDQRELLLYTCYPIDAFGMTNQRVFVTATLAKGPTIDATR